MISKLAYQIRFTRPSLERWRKLIPMVTQPALVTSVIVTGLVLGVRQVGGWQPLELAAYDRLVQLQPDLGPDPRLLVVAITESDIQAQNRWPISDQAIAQALAELQRYQPAAIGLDILREIPQPPGRTSLLQQLQAPNVVTISTLGDTANNKTKAPPGVPSDRVGFNDIVFDSDNVIRRNFLFGETDNAEFASLSLRLASKYLAPRGITPQQPWKSYQAVRWGEAVFTPLQPNSGGYINGDAGGYQVLLSYHSNQRVARQVTLTQVLQRQVNPAWIKDKIILIGTTAPSIKDLFPTPYSAIEQGNPEMPGVLIHAHMVSQFISAALGQRSLVWFWPEWAEGLWIWGWSAVGALLAWRVRHPVYLGLMGVAAVGGLYLVCYGWFTQSAWIPFVPPAIALLTTAGSLVSYFAYQAYQERKTIAEQVEDQEKTIALLQTLLTGTPTIALTSAPTSAANGDTTLIPTQSTKRSVSTQVPTSSTKSNDATEAINTRTYSDQHVANDVEDPISDRPRFLLSRRYKIDRVLASGGFSLTYLAQDTQRPGNPLCVVKHLVPARSDVRFLQTARRLFKTEAEILEKLGKHDQIPQLLASFEENAEFYLVEEFIAGHPLSEELPSGKRLSEAQVVGLLRPILEVLAFLHERHVIHRDLKPSNIMRRQLDQQLVLIDFGAVKQMQPQDYSASRQSAQEEGFTVAIGTRGYAPPEQLAGYPGLSSDVYALGMIAIQALTGFFPYQLSPNPETGTVIWREFTEVSDQFAAVLDRMVCYYFNERYQSAGEVLRDLKALET
ncbi:CHASE2 domain-containing serine/threonine-protein kinase [Trichocoleus sp. FACHB-262]|uniref:CHASE2 domain-containing serine/threonine-protein kinase n=1 Tax=Trichocoleus sp. FACHB-262 TaxID=2692869 RepID=UPI0028C3BC40|nr:CHASE2 domain-containing serine/threonine-protein kinase [Trichocoleus sp. FACHB-262]